MSRNIKSAAAYAAASVFAFIFNRIYALFSHGVSSDSMSHMWIWLLGLGSAFYLILELLSFRKEKNIYYPLCANIYNSGVAVLVVKMLLEGIFEIAGTGSEFMTVYNAAAAAFISIGVAAISVNLIKSKTAAKKN